MTTTRWGQLEVQAVEMTGQRAGRLVAKHQMDSTNCLNAFSLICNWPHLWLNSLALPAVLSSTVGSPLAYTVQAPISMTVPARAVHLPVMPSHSKKICLISSVKHPQHISCLYFSFIFFGFFLSSLIDVSCCDLSQRGILWGWYRTAGICHLTLC